MYQKYGQVLAAVLEIYFCTAIFFGWPNLSKIFREEKFFACGNVTAIEQCSIDLSVPFVGSTSMFCIFALVCGVIYDKFGTAATRLLGNILFLLAVVLLAIAKPGSTDM